MGPIRKNSIDPKAAPMIEKKFSLMGDLMGVLKEDGIFSDKEQPKASSNAKVKINPI